MTRITESFSQLLDFTDYYIVKWTEGQNIVNPVFEGVEVVNSSDVERTVTSYDEKVAFKGNYSPVNIGSGGDNTLLYLGANNTLYYPSKTMSINASAPTSS